MRHFAFCGLAGLHPNLVCQCCVKDKFIAPVDLNAKRTAKGLTMEHRYDRTGNEPELGKMAEVLGILVADPANSGAAPGGKVPQSPLGNLRYRAAL